MKLSKGNLTIETGIRPTMRKVISLPVTLNNGRDLSITVYVTCSMFGPEPPDALLTEIAQALMISNSNGAPEPKEFFEDIDSEGAQ